MAAFLATAGAQVVGGLIGAATSAYQGWKSQERANKLDQQLRVALSQRPDIPDLGGMIQDRSSLIQNEMANLQVSTEAAKYQAEETDLSLAGTLDTLRAGGFGSGGATSLAQAALRSKRDIGADIARQEASNVAARAQGAQAAQQARLAELGRVESARIGAAQYKFGIEESRKQQDIDRAAAQLDAANRQTAQYKDAAWSSLGSALGAAGGVGLGAYAKDTNWASAFNTPNTTV